MCNRNKQNNVCVSSFVLLVVVVWNESIVRTTANPTYEQRVGIRVH